MIFFTYLGRGTLMNNQRLSTIRIQKSYHILPVKPGQMLELHEKVWEWSNARIWKFKWLVIKVKKMNHVDWTFTIRWKAAGHTIEKIYPLSFTQFEKVILLDAYKVRRAKLYYLRDKVGKAARMTSIAEADEKWVDLLKLSIEEIEQLHKEYLSSTSSNEQEQEQQQEEQQEEQQQEEQQQEEQQQEEQQQEEQQEEEQQQEEA